MVFGTFDNLHPGHLSYFQQARGFGESLAKRAKVKNEVELIAVVARDKNVLRIKGRATQENEKTRVKKVRAALKKMAVKEEGSGRMAGSGKKIFRVRAVLGAAKNQWAVLKKYRPDAICLGYDQKVDLSKLKGEIAKFRLSCKIKRMMAYHPEKYKSSYCRGNK